MGIKPHRTGFPPATVRAATYMRPARTIAHVVKEVAPILLYAAILGTCAVALSMVAVKVAGESFPEDLARALAILAVVVPAGLFARRRLNSE